MALYTTLRVERNFANFFSIDFKSGGDFKKRFFAMNPIFVSSKTCLKKIGIIAKNRFLKSPPLLKSIENMFAKFLPYSQSDINC